MRLESEIFYFFILINSTFMKAIVFFSFIFVKDTMEYVIVQKDIRVLSTRCKKEMKNKM